MKQIWFYEKAYLSKIFDKSFIKTNKTDHV